MDGELEGLTIHERASFVSLLVFLTLPVIPPTNRKPLREISYVYLEVELSFCTFGCGLLFGLQSFLFSSLVPFALCFSFTYLFILPYTKRCKGNSLLQIKILTYFMYSGRPFSLPPAIATISN
jgi:hypothetical protein